MASSSNSSQPLLYACIAHGTTILTEHTASAASNASSLASEVLPKITKRQDMKTLTSGDKLQCHYIAASPSDYRNAPSAGGLNYVVVTKDGTSRNIAFGFLANIKNRFLELHQPGSTDFGSLPAYGAAAFNTTLRKMMVEQGTTNDGKQDAIRQAQKEIGETRGILNETVILATERGNQLSSIQEQTEHLAAHSSSFRYGATNLKRRMWWKNVKLMVLLVLVVVFLVYLFVGFGCGLPAWSRCVGH